MLALSIGIRIWTPCLNQPLESKTIASNTLLSRTHDALHAEAHANDPFTRERKCESRQRQADLAGNAIRSRDEHHPRRVSPITHRTRHFPTTAAGDVRVTRQRSRDDTRKGENEKHLLNLERKTATPASKAVAALDRMPAIGATQADARPEGDRNIVYAKRPNRKRISRIRFSSMTIDNK